jgi:Zn-finger nucleic acid-binding protein
MKCPVDGATLTMADRSGVEIDYCPQCRGVWLDRGELDKILDRAGRESSGFAERREERRPDDRPREAAYRPEKRPDDGDDDYKRQDPRYRKRESWWSDIFDF